MKKFISMLSIFLFLSFTLNTLTTLAQTKTYSQGFYTMNDLNFVENINYIVQNNEPYSGGLLIILDSNKKIKQLLDIEPSSIRNPIIPLKAEYRFVIYGDVHLTFKQANIS